MRRLATAALLLAGAAPLAALRPSGDGPPPGHTGGFGEPTCLACHVGEEPEAPGGSLRIEGLPERFVPGARYRVAVVVERAGLARAGFQLAVRYLDGDSAGIGAGAIRVLDSRAQIVADTVRRVPYIEHTRLGSAATGGRTRWEFEWIAPGTARDVVVHAASVAANDDDSNLGDVVVRRSVRVTAGNGERGTGNGGP